MESEKRDNDSEEENEDVTEILAQSYADKDIDNVLTDKGVSEEIIEVHEDVEEEPQD
jgi:hypothetical protein